jgi:hypothetical protein
VRRSVVFCGLVFVACHHPNTATPEAAAPKRVAPPPAPAASAAAQPSACEPVPVDLARAKQAHVDSVSWSRDGALVAAAVNQTGAAGEHVEGAEGIVVWSAHDGVVRHRYRVEAQQVAFASDGRLAFASWNGAGLVDLARGCARRWPAAAHMVSFGADGRSLYVAGDQWVAQLDPETGAILRAHQIEDGGRFVVMDVAGSAVALLDEMHAARVLTNDLSSARRLATQTHSILNARAIALSPDASKVALPHVEMTAIRYPPNVMPGPPERAHVSVRVVSLPDARELDRFGRRRRRRDGLFARRREPRRGRLRRGPSHDRDPRDACARQVRGIPTTDRVVPGRPRRRAGRLARRRSPLRSGRRRAPGSGSVIHAETGTHKPAQRRAERPVRLLTSQRSSPKARPQVVS